MGPEFHRPTVRDIVRVVEGLGVGALVLAKTVPAFAQEASEIGQTPSRLPLQFFVEDTIFRTASPIAFGKDVPMPCPSGTAMYTVTNASGLENEGFLIRQSAWYVAAGHRGPSNPLIISTDRPDGKYPGVELVDCKDARGNSISSITMLYEITLATAQANLL